ncbi:hypothetical protein SDJN03_18534, partial [Cucurbita argyrosperma subsp. sororia]
MVAQGLDKRPLKELVAEISTRKFNCVRLTWSVHMFTRYAYETIGDVFDGLDIADVKNGVKKHNPEILKMTVAKAFQTVINALGSEKIMVILDNHISQPRWCCSLHDGNGFFGDCNFNPSEWLQGLSFVAVQFTCNPYVVGMSLRNELRGSLSNADAWCYYVRQGSQLIHRINPNLLVVISGLNYDNDLSHLKKRPLGYTLHNKVVLEAHLYSFSGDHESKFTKNPLNVICDQIMEKFEKEAGFVVDMENPYPLFLSEFGYDQSGGNDAQNRFMSCFLARIVEKDIDWALWAFQGSYMYRQGHQDIEESFGVMDYSWTKDRNPKLQQLLQLAKRINQDPNSKAPMSYIMLHPASGQCVKSNSNGEAELGDCTAPTQWNHSGDASLMKLSSGKCLKSAGDGKSPVVSDDCSGDGSNWTVASKAKLQLATKIGEDNFCLEKGSDTSIVVKKCICVDEGSCMDDPQSQWFKLIPTNVA